MTKSNRANHALQNVNPLNNQHRSSNTMTKRNTLSLSLVALVVTSSLLIACGADPAKDSLDPVQLDVSARADSCDSHCADVQFCVANVNDTANTVNPTTTRTCIDLDLSTGTASGSFADLSKVGEYTLSFSGLPTGMYVHYDVGGFMVTNSMTLHRGTNTLSVIIDTTANPGTGGSGGSSGTGGNSGTGGSNVAGSDAGGHDAGGETSTGGSSGVAGSSSTGGSSGVAGSSSTGGSSGVAGSSSTGGSSGVAGSDAGAAGSDTGVGGNAPVTTDGNACFWVTKDSAPLSGCTFDLQQILGNPDPVSANPPANCTGAGKYYYSVPAGQYHVSVTCNGNTLPATVTIVAGNSQTVPIVFPSTVAPTGNLCVRMMGLPIDLDTSSANMGDWLGYSNGTDCVAATPTQLTTMTVAGWSGPSCVDKSDTQCAISVAGLVVTVPSWAAYAPKERRVFTVVVTDGNTSNVVYIDTRNDHYQPL